jgi:hypothetical protein
MWNTSVAPRSALLTSWGEVQQHHPPQIRALVNYMVRQTEAHVSCAASDDDAARGSSRKLRLRHFVLLFKVG